MKNHWLYEYDDETSSFDPKGRWSGGDSYYRTFKIWIPDRIKPDNEEALDRYVEKNQGNEKVWVD